VRVHHKLQRSAALSLAALEHNTQVYTHTYAHTLIHTPLLPAPGAVHRYRKKVEKDEDYIRAVVQLGAAVEGLIKHNNALDIYQEYFAECSAQHSTEPPSARTLTVLKDPTAAASGVARPVSHVNWLQDGGSKVALSYAILGFQQQQPGARVCVRGGCRVRRVVSSRAWSELERP
jgi:hypothetical protein